MNKLPNSAILLDDFNRVVCVQPTRKPKDSHQMVAQDLQEKNASKVKVYNITYGDRECMAFGFEVKEKTVFPVVSHDQQVCFKVLDVEDKKIIFDETFLFQWGEQPISEQCRTLKSVAEPKKYLHVEKSGKVSITEQGYSFFKIQNSKQEKANAANRNKTVEFNESGKIQENEINKYKKISWQRRSLKRKPSCCKGSVASHQPLRCNDRKTKRMKMSVKS